MANSGVNVRIEVSINGLDRSMLMIAGEIDQMREPLLNSATHMEQSIGRRFRSGGGSRPWAALSPNTILRHPHRRGGKPLNDTGRLKMSATAGATQRITSRRLNYSYGSGVPYAATHNFGRGAIPQREFMYFDQKDETAIRRIFEDYIREVISRA